MDSSAALHLRGTGPIFLRPVIRNPARAVRWSAWLVAEAAAPRSVLPLKPRRIELGMRFILFLVTSQSKVWATARTRTGQEQGPHVPRLQAQKGV